MNKLFLILAVSIFLMTSCYGCSFIESKFENKQNQRPPGQEENQDEQRPSKPIPVNPQHS